MLAFLKGSLLDDVDFINWVQKNQNGPRSACSSHKDDLTPERRSSESSESSEASAISSTKSGNEKKERRPSGGLLHFLHMDRWARELEEKDRLHEAAVIKEEVDMLKWEAKVKERIVKTNKRREERSNGEKT